MGFAYTVGSDGNTVVAGFSRASDIIYNNTYLEQSAPQFTTAVDVTNSGGTVPENGRHLASKYAPNTKPEPRRAPQPPTICPTRCCPIRSTGPWK